MQQTDNNLDAWVAKALHAENNPLPKNYGIL